MGNRRSSTGAPIGSVAILCVTALLLFGYGNAAAGSSRATPEIGRCEPAASWKEGRSPEFSGLYANPRCTKADQQGGEFEWSPSDEAVKFTGSADAAIFQTAKKPRIRCSAVSATGQYTGTTGVMVRFTFANCTTGTFVCHSDGQPSGVIVSSLLAGEVGTLEVGEGMVGAQLEPVGGAEPDFADFECPIPVRLKGSIVGRVPTINKMSTAMRFHFGVENGAQTFQGLQGRRPALLTLTAGSADTTHTEAAGLKMQLTQNSEEAIEIRA